MENFLSTLLLIPLLCGFAAIGLICLYLGLEKLRVLLASPFWPRTPGSFVRSYVTTTSKSFYAGGDADAYRREAGTYVWEGPFGTTVTRTSRYLHRIYRYEAAGKHYEADSLALPWNHIFSGLVGQSGESDAALAERLKRQSLTIRYNPRKPRDHLLGYRHFPYLLMLIQLIAGLFLATALGALLSTLGELAGLPEPRFGPGRYSVYGLLAPALAAVWLAWRLLQSFTGLGRQGPSGKKRKKRDSSPGNSGLSD